MLDIITYRKFLNNMKRRFICHNKGCNRFLHIFEMSMPQNNINNIVLNLILITSIVTLVITYYLYKKRYKNNLIPFQKSY